MYHGAYHANEYVFDMPLKPLSSAIYSTSRFMHAATAISLQVFFLWILLDFTSSLVELIYNC